MKRSVPKEIPSEIEVSLVKMIVITWDNCITIMTLLIDIFISSYKTSGDTVAVSNILLELPAVKCIYFSIACLYVFKGQNGI